MKCKEFKKDNVALKLLCNTTKLGTHTILHDLMHGHWNSSVCIMEYAHSVVDRDYCLSLATQLLSHTHQTG